MGGGEVVIVQCPRCSTRYRIDEKRITRKNPTFKCSRCKLVFPRHPEEGAEAKVPPAVSHNKRSSTAGASQVQSAETATLPFLEAEQHDLAPNEGLVCQKAGGEQTEKSSRASRAGQHNGAAGLPGSAPLLEETRAAVEGTPQARAASRSARNWVESPAGALIQKRRSSFKAVCIAIGTVLLGHVMLALYLKGSYERTEGFFSLLPFVGKALLEERALACKVTLRKVRGRYEIIKDRRKVFAISGEAVNNSATAVRDIQVEGTIRDKNGRRWRKVIFCGNETRLTELSTREIDLLHRLDPTYSLEPGESKPFVIVFTDPPGDLKEFTSRVVSVRPVPQGTNSRGVASFPDGGVASFPEGTTATSRYDPTTALPPKSRKQVNNKVGAPQGFLLPAPTIG